MNDNFIEYQLVNNITEFETMDISIEKSEAVYGFLPDGREEMIHQSQLFSKLSVYIMDYLKDKVQEFSFVDTRSDYTELDNNINGKYLITNQLLISEFTMSQYYTTKKSNKIKQTSNLDFFGSFKDCKCYMDLYAHFTDTTCYFLDNKVTCEYNIDKFEDLNNITYKLKYKIIFDGNISSTFFIRDESDKRWMVPLRDDKFDELFS